MHCCKAQATNLNAPGPGLRRYRRRVPLGLAPDGVYQDISRQMSSWSLTPRFHPCLCADEPRHRRSVSVALSFSSRWLDVIQHPCPVEPGLSSRGAMRRQRLSVKLPAPNSIPPPVRILNRQMLTRECRCANAERQMATWNGRMRKCGPMKV